MSRFEGRRSGSTSEHWDSCPATWNMMSVLKEKTSVSGVSLDPSLHLILKPKKTPTRSQSPRCWALEEHPRTAASLLGRAERTARTGRTEREKRNPPIRTKTCTTIQATSGLTLDSLPLASLTQIYTNDIVLGQMLQHHASCKCAHSH